MRTRKIIWQAVVLAMALTAIPSLKPARALEAADVQARIARVRAELNTISEALEVTGHRMEESLAAVKRHRKALSEASVRRAKLRRLVGDRAAQLYMIGSEAEFAIGQDVTDIADKLNYLAEMDRGSRGLLEEIRTLEESATTETKALNTSLADARVARADLDARRREVSSRLADLSSLYDFLRSIDPRFAGRASRSGARGFVCPVVGPTSVRNNYGTPRPGGPHTGIDMAGNTGQGLVAVLPSTVVDVPRGGWMGIGIIIRDPAGNEWWYAHLSSANVSRGERLSAGEFIGRIGCTGHCFGSHLHFEYHPGGGDPTNPYRILSAAC